jgi:hypothetical protein
MATHDAALGVDARWEDESGVWQIPFVRRHAERHRLGAPTSEEVLDRIMDDVCVPILRAETVDAMVEMISAKLRLYRKLHAAWQVLEKASSGTHTESSGPMVKDQIIEHCTSVLGREVLGDVKHALHAASVAHDITRKLAASDAAPEVAEADLVLWLKYDASQDLLSMLFTCLAISIDEPTPATNLGALVGLARSTASRCLDLAIEAQDLRDDDGGEGDPEDVAPDMARYVLTPDGIKTFRDLG